jgi:hypothetical protein
LILKACWQCALANLLIRYYKTTAILKPQLLENREETNMSQTTVKFSIEKETKNSVRYKEEPEDGKAPIMGTLYVQKWFAGDSKNIEITIEKKD